MIRQHGNVLEAIELLKRHCSSSTVACHRVTIHPAEREEVDRRPSGEVAAVSTAPPWKACRAGPRAGKDQGPPRESVMRHARASGGARRRSPPPDATARWSQERRRATDGEASNESDAAFSIVAAWRPYAGALAEPSGQRFLVKAMAAGRKRRALARSDTASIAWRTVRRSEPYSVFVEIGEDRIPSVSSSG